MRGEPMMRALGKSIPLALFLLCGVGCGYRFQGAAAPDPTIEVLLFENRTVETGIESIVTGRILDELRRTPGWRVVPPGHGRYVLSGVIRSFDFDPRSISSRRLAEEHRATLTVELRFRDRVENKDLWRVPALSAFADYQVGGNVLLNENQKRAAVARIAEELASRIRVHIQDTW